MTTQRAVLMRDFAFEAAHRITNHTGKCRNLHGHSWRVRVELIGPVDDATGMSVDFYHVKRICASLFDDWDHSALLHERDPLVDLCARLASHAHVFDFQPTCENLTAFALRALTQAFAPEFPMLHVASVTLRETANCAATTCAVSDFAGRCVRQIGGTR